MATETGNAQSQVADPSQSYGAGKYLQNIPAFGLQQTPTATYQGPIPSKINLQPAEDPFPWLNNLPVMNYESDDGGPDYGGSFGTGPTAGKYKNEIADPFEGVSNVSRYSGKLGSILGPVGSLIGTGVGAYADVQSVQDRLKNLGYDYQFTTKDYVGLAPSAITGIFGDTPKDIARTRYKDFLDDYVKSRPELGLINQEDMAMGQSFADKGIKSAFDASLDKIRSLQNSGLPQEAIAEDLAAAWREYAALESQYGSVHARDLGFNNFGGWMDSLQNDPGIYKYAYDGPWMSGYLDPDNPGGFGGDDAGGGYSGGGGFNDDGSEADQN